MLWRLSHEAIRYRGLYVIAILATLCLTVVNLAAPKVLSSMTGIVERGVDEAGLQRIFTLTAVLVALYLLRNVLERFSRFGLPIHFTENTLISGELMPAYIEDLNDWQVDEWPSTPEYEERQAKEIAEMYSILFAYPLVEAITTWNFNDGCWLKAPSGFVHEDNTEKPSYRALKGLIHGEWETHEEARTDENGFLTLTGFQGRYTL